jgi:hypothetical protein
MMIFSLSWMHLKDISSVRVVKEIMNINRQQGLILTTTSPLNGVKNEVKEVTPTSAIEDDMILIKPYYL